MHRALEWEGLPSLGCRGAYRARTAPFNSPAPAFIHNVCHCIDLAFTCRGNSCTDVMMTSCECEWWGGVATRHIAPRDGRERVVAYYIRTGSPGPACAICHMPHADT
eukprot:scaffold19004_cov146-Isochrysis_galbana.AAC.1